MRIYGSIDEFQTNLGHVRKWMRSGQAIAAARDLPEGVAYSMGDSLTFWNTLPSDLADGRFIGHRRYHTVFAPVGPMAVQVAAKAVLTVAESYDDTTDRECFEMPKMTEDDGSTSDVRLVEVPAGGVLILEEDEAWRVPATSGASSGEETSSPVTVLHVTVEGFTFPNK